MKHTKKLIPAIGMLLLSACMLVTSTFAWFSMNTTVRATGMSVTAKGDQVYLQIINEGENFNASAAQIVASAGKQGLNLQPVNVTAGINTGNTSCLAYDATKPLVWVSASSATVDQHAPATGYSQAAADAKHVLETSFKIRLNADAGKTEATAPLTVSSVKFTSEVEGTTMTDDAFAHCVSVLIVCGDQSMLYKQTSTTTTQTNDEGEEETVVTYNIGKFERVTGSSEFLDKDATKNVFNNTSGVSVTVYVFFDGDNPNCTIAGLNAADDNKTTGYSVDVSFTCAA